MGDKVGRGQIEGDVDAGEGCKIRLPVHYDTVHGPPLTRSEEAELKKQLEVVLKQVQSSVKAMGLQPVDLEIVRPVLGISHAFPGHRYAALWQSNMIKNALFPDSWLSRAPRPSARSTEDVLLQEEQNRKLVEAIEKVSLQMKLQIRNGLQHKHITKEFAEQLLAIVKCLDRNMQIALNSGGHFFTLSGFLQKVMMKMPQDVKTWAGDFQNYGALALYLVKFTDRAIKCIGTSHVQFTSIGKEAIGILDIDYSFDKLRISSDPFENLSFGLGAQQDGLQSTTELMVKFKNENNSICCNLKSVDDIWNDPPNAGGAALNPNENIDISTVKISLDKFSRGDMKSVVKLAYPSLKGKIEVRHVSPYLVCAGGVEMIQNPGGADLRNIPVLDLSAVWGIKYVGAGARFQIRQGQLISSIGMSLRTKLLAVGLTRKFPGHYNATICKELVDRNTTVAARASYLPAGAPPEAGVNPGFGFTLGVKHVVDPSLYGKARIGTDGASLQIKKSNSSGKFSVKGAAHLDFHEPQRRSKIGIAFSFRS